MGMDARRGGGRLLVRPCLRTGQQPLGEPHLLQNPEYPALETDLLPFFFRQG